MTILAPGTKYYEAWCSIHGVVHEGVDFEAMSADLAHHSVTLRCPNTRFASRVAGQLDYSRVDTPPVAPTPSLEAPGDTLERLPAKVVARAREHVPAVLEPPPRYDAVYQEAAERMAADEPSLSDATLVIDTPTYMVWNIKPHDPAGGFLGTVTPLAWTPPQPDMRIEDWLAEVALLVTMRDRLQWSLGDALLYGEVRYGEAWSQVADQYNRHTLENCRWVASRFPAGRRREGLSFSHHAEVAKLEPVDQDAWLDRATAEALPRAELRKALRGAQAEPETHTCPLCGKEHRVA